MSVSRRAACLVLFGCSIQMASCHDSSGLRVMKQTPTPEVIAQTPHVDYADSDAFDEVLKSALIRHDRLIVIQTVETQPAWSGRLTAWIAAWNEGGPAHEPGVSSTRSLIELPPDLACETRQAITDQMDRIERLAVDMHGWWQDERKRRDRIEMLKPYMICVTRDQNQRLQVVFYYCQ
jgi:hypothetical protein